MTTDPVFPLVVFLALAILIIFRSFIHTQKLNPKDTSLDQYAQKIEKILQRMRSNVFIGDSARQVLCREIIWGVCLRVNITKDRDELILVCTREMVLFTRDLKDELERNRQLPFEVSVLTDKKYEESLSVPEA